MRNLEYINAKQNVTKVFKLNNIKQYKSVCEFEN